MADRVFLLFRDLGACLSVLGKIEERIIAKAVLSIDAVSDQAFHGTEYHMFAAIGKDSGDSCYEPCSPFRFRHILHSLHDLFHLVVIIRVTTEIAGGVDTGLPVQRIDHKPRIVAHHGDLCICRVKSESAFRGIKRQRTFCSIRKESAVRNLLADKCRYGPRLDQRVFFERSAGFLRVRRDTCFLHGEDFRVGIGNDVLDLTDLVLVACCEYDQLFHLFLL